MFGFGKTKTEQMVLKLEEVMMSIEAAYDKGDYHLAHIGAHEKQCILLWLNLNGKWSEERITKYLQERGLVRSVRNEAYNNEIALKLMCT
jgi:hypothetical protein